MENKELEKKELNPENLEQVSGAGYISNKGKLSLQIRYMKSKGLSLEYITENICKFAVNAGYLVNPSERDFVELNSLIRVFYESLSAES